jgi:hypothetical protein
MSLRIDKDNAYLILPESRYSISQRIDGSMDGDFTLHVRAKAFKETLTDKKSYIIARNGQHCGIAINRNDENIYSISFEYWFFNKSDINKTVPLYKMIRHELLSEVLFEYNDYTMISVGNEINCYFNEELIGTINFSGLNKKSYIDSFFWFSCGDMIGTEEYRCSGDFEYNFSFLLNESTDISTVMDIVNNYKIKYTHTYNDNLLKINDDFDLKSQLIFMIEFENKNKYKQWNMAFNGSFPQLYLENNIYF